MTLQLHRFPVYRSIPIEALRPTQMTVGQREIARRIDKIRKMSKDEVRSYLHQRIIPAVKGPGKRLFVVDRHHLLRALRDSGMEKVSVMVVLDLHRFEDHKFWAAMDARRMVHPFDENGRQRAHTDIPHTIDSMTDDPFRSLAGALRRSGGYAKDGAPFAEFQWANHLRRRLEKAYVERNFDKALETALVLASRPEAGHLPGWRGPLPAGGLMAHFFGGGLAQDRLQPFCEA